MGCKLAFGIVLKLPICSAMGAKFHGKYLLLTLERDYHGTFYSVFFFLDIALESTIFQLCSGPHIGEFLLL